MVNTITPIMDQNQQSHGIDEIFNESSKIIENLHNALSNRVSIISIVLYFFRIELYNFKDHKLLLIAIQIRPSIQKCSFAIVATERWISANIDGLART